MAAKTHVSAQQNASKFTGKLRTIALAVVSLGFIMDLLDSTIVNVAIPSIQGNLNASYSSIQWLIAGYTLSFALLLITGGRMGDVYGYKKIFMIGMAGFTLASLLSGLAWSPLSLIVFRLIQGSMAAIMVPQVMSMMQIMYKPSERGSVMGLFGMMAGIAASLGPIIGGLLIEANILNLDWRPIFLINVPVGIVGLILAAKYLPEGKSSHPIKLDISGTFIVIIAMLLLIFPLIEGRELGWPLWSYLMLAASVPAFIFFAWWQKREEREKRAPLIQPVLFKNRSFGIGLTINMIFEAAMLGFFLTFGLILQIGFGFTPIHAALTGLPIAIAIAFTMATMSEKVIPKLGRTAIHIGTGVMATGLLILSWVLNHYRLEIHSWQLIPGLFIVGVGMGFVFGTLFAAVLSGVDTKHAGSASGTLNAVQQVGGSIGIALIGIVFFGQLNHAAATSFESIQPKLTQSLQSQNIPVDAQNAIISGVKNCFVDRSKEKDNTIVPESCQHATAVNEQIGAIVSEAGKEANARNFTNAFHWGVLFEVSLLAVTFCLAFFLPRKFKTEAYEGH